MRDVTEIIVVLGEKSDINGELSSIARERAHGCFELYHQKPLKVLVAGGYGDLESHPFEPHAYQLRDFMIELGIPQESFLEPALGRNTLENALLIRDSIADSEIATLHIVTSDFHRRRAQYIFEQLFEGFQIRFHTCHTALPQLQIEALERHESNAWEKLLSSPSQQQT